MKDKLKIKKFNHKKRFFLTAYFILISLIFGVTATYAWFSSVLVNIGGDLGLGNLSATARIYENYDDSGNIDNFIDGLTDAKIIDSNGTNISAFNMIEKRWYSNAFTSIYVEVENTGTIDLKSILKVTYDNENVKTFLSYYYYQIVDISQNISVSSQLTSREKLAEYNIAYQSGINENINTYISNIVENGHSITSNLTTINMGITTTQSSSFFRLDIAVAEMPTELLTQYNALSTLEKEIKINASITIKQTNAPDDDSAESGTSVYVSSADAFISAVYGASNGDNIYLSNNIIISRNITITRRINIFLNGFNLMVAGNFAYDVSVAGSITLDVSNNSVLSVNGNLLIDAPNATFKLLGSGGAHSVILGTVGQENTGRFYVNNLLDENNTQTYGYYQYGVSVVNQVSAEQQLATMHVDSNTRVSIGLSSKIGPIISSNGASNIQIYNYGEIERINFSNMSILQTNKIQINIYNRNKFLADPIQVVLPAWSIGWLSKDIENHPSAINTVIRNEPGSTPITGVEGSQFFLARDIQDGDMATDSVIHLGGNKYRVNFQLDMYGNDTFKLINYFQVYYQNLFNNATEADFENWLSGIEAVSLYTYSTTSVKPADFEFINTKLTTVKTVDLSFATIQGANIPSSAFYNKTSLQEFLFPLSQLQIGDYAFYGTSLDKITIHSSIISIGVGAFDIDTSVNGLLEVFYEGENTSGLVNNILGFTETKTLLFMSLSNLENFKREFSITDTWYINSYATYNFVDNNQYYYRVVDGNSVEIVYFGGNWHENLVIPNSINNNNNSYRVVGISNSAFRRSINKSENVFANLSFSSNLTTIKADAFYGAKINVLSLNNVSIIGDYSFAHTTIHSSISRSESFSGMIAVGKFAFESTVIGTSTTTLQAFESYNVVNGEIKNSLELQGNYLPGQGVFSSAELNGVKLNLTGVTSITSDMTNNLSLYGSELILNRVKSIGNSAFEARFKNYTALSIYNKVFAQEIQTIGSLAFKEMHLNEFVIGVQTMFNNQLDVNINVNYGGISGGIFASDFKVTNLVIDGLLPELSLQTSTYIFGSATAGREYTNVTVRNTNGKLYDFMFYSAQSTYTVSIQNLNLYDISLIGNYALHYASVSDVNFYSSNNLIATSTITNVGESAFRYSNVSSMGDLILLSIGKYAFANSTVPASNITVNGSVDEYAFASSNTTNIEEITLNGTVGNYVFSQALIYNVENIYINSSIGESVFENSRIYDLENLVFNNTTVTSNTFNEAIIFSFSTIRSLGVSHAEVLAFNNLNAVNSTLDLTNFLTIKFSAVKQIVVKNLILGNTNFYNNNSTFMYGSSDGGIFAQGAVSSIENLHINGELPQQRASTNILGAKGANINISNIYISESVGNIPAYLFYSENITNRVRIGNLHFASQSLIIGERAFGGIYVDNMIYSGTIEAINPPEISFSGTNAFYLASIGDFENFVYFDAAQQKNKSVIPVIYDYTFHYATFRQDANLSLFESASTLGNYAFKSATFAKDNLGQNISLNLSQVLTIGHSIFDGLYNEIDTITIGNQSYSQANLPDYYYGNPVGSEGVFASASNLVINSVIINGNLPETNVGSVYQTKVFGISGTNQLTIRNITINQNVTKISAFAFSGASTIYKTSISNIDILSTNLLIDQSAFEYTDITYLTINGSNISLGKKAFKHSILRNMVYDREQSVGQITFSTGATNVFEGAIIYSMTGFSTVNSGVFKEIGAYAFLNATFESDLNLGWINFVQNIGNNAFEAAIFTRSSNNEYVSINLSNAITIGEEVFAFIPIKIGNLTLGNSSFESLYGTTYSYGNGIRGVLYASGRIDILNIVGNLPNNNTYSMLGNSYTNINYSTNIGTINISQNVTSIPNNTFISQSKDVPLIIGTLNVNSTNTNIGANAFKFATITTISFNGQNTTLQENAFSFSSLTNVNFSSNLTYLGQHSFANSVIVNLNYLGSTSGQIHMNGSHTFANSQLANINNFLLVNGSNHYGIVKNISNNAFENAIFARDINLRWIEYVTSIGSFAFSKTTFTTSSLGEFVSFDLSNVLSVGANAFYQLPVRLGTITIGNSSYTTNSSYAYGNGTNGIFDNVGRIDHLIINGNLPNTENQFGNRSLNSSFLTSYGIVEINSNVSYLPVNLFAGVDVAYSTQISHLYIYSLVLEVRAGFVHNTVITNLYIPNATTFHNVGENAFRNASISNKVIPLTLTISGQVDDYAFYAFNFNNLTINLEAVSYIGSYAFAYINYNKNLVFNAPLSLVEGDYAFSNSNLSGNLTFNNLRSFGSNVFQGMISGNNVTYIFTFQNISTLESDYAFANMNGGGTVFVKINNLPSLHSYKAFYASTNITTITFNESVVDLNADNIFESADNLTGISFTNTNQVVLVNATIISIPGDAKIYVPGNLLTAYLSDIYWSLVASKISTTYNLDSTQIWGFYLLSIAGNASLEKYLGTATSVTIPSSITYKGTSYNVRSIGQDTFAGTAVTTITIPRTIQSVDMGIFSNSNISNVSFNGTGTDPFHIATESSQKIIYESSSKRVLYKYLSSNTATTYTIPNTVIEVAAKAFYKNNALQTITFTAGTEDKRSYSWSSYSTTYSSYFTLAENSISEMPSLTTINITNYSLGYGVILNSNAISLNPALTAITIIAFETKVNSYAVSNNIGLRNVNLQPCSIKFGYGTSIFGGGGSFSSLSIKPYAFSGSGAPSLSTTFYTNMHTLQIFSNAFASSKVNIFDFNIDPTATNYNVFVYSADAFAVGVKVELINGEIIQTYDPITIKVPSNRITNYQALPGFSFYASSIVAR